MLAGIKVANGLGSLVDVWLIGCACIMNASEYGVLSQRRCSTPYMLDEVQFTRSVGMDVPSSTQEPWNYCASTQPTPLLSFLQSLNGGERHQPNMRICLKQAHSESSSKGVGRVLIA